jgi:predicted nucleic acid-binding protein
MNSYFFDSSALVKRYLTETGSDWVHSNTEAFFRLDCLA